MDSTKTFFKGLDMQMEKQIVEFLRATDPDMEIGGAVSMQDCVEMMMDKITEMELDYSILSTAFVNGVNPNRFDDFYEAVMAQYETIREGDEIPEAILDRIAAQYR